MKEKDIVFEAGQYWVGKVLGGWATFKNGTSVATSLGIWAQDVDGLSIAIKYADYKAGGTMTAADSLKLAQQHYQGEKRGRSRHQQHGRSGVPHGDFAANSALSPC